MSGPLDLTGRWRLWRQPELGVWRRAAVRAIAEVDPSLRPAPGGDPTLREQLGALLGVPPADLVITSGVRAAAPHLARSCGAMVVERPTFQGVVDALRAAGVAVHPRPWPDLVDSARPGWGLWFTTPCRNPDGRSADPSLLAGLADAVNRGCRVVCNGAYRWFGQPPELPDGVIQVGTLHKLAGPGAGLGWVIGADRRHLPGLAAGPLHWQRTWTHFLAAGGLELLVSRHRELVVARREFLAAAALAGDAVADGGGPNLLLRVPGPEDAMVAHLARAGVLVSPGSAFDAPEPSVRICLTGVPVADAAAAAARLRQVLDDQLVNGNWVR